MSLWASIGEMSVLNIETSDDWLLVAVEVEDDGDMGGSMVGLTIGR